MSADDRTPKIRVRAAQATGTEAGGEQPLSLDNMREQLALGFLRAAGGVDGLCRELWRDFRRAKQGSAERIRIYNLVLSLFTKSDEEEISEDEMNAIITMLKHMTENDGETQRDT